MAELSKKILAENIKKYMAIKGVSRQDLCDTLNLKYTTLANWLNGTTYPRIDKVELLASYFDCEKTDLIEENPIHYSRCVKLPIIGSVVAGVPLEESQDIEGYVEVSGDTSDTYALRVHGDSMDPEIHDGDSVIIEKKNSYKNGDIVVARVNGYEYTVKKYHRDKSNIMLIPINRDFVPMVYDENTIAIEGKVIEVRRKYA